MHTRFYRTGEQIQGLHRDRVCLVKLVELGVGPGDHWVTNSDRRERQSRAQTTEHVVPGADPGNVDSPVPVVVEERIGLGLVDFKATAERCLAVILASVRAAPAAYAPSELLVWNGDIHDPLGSAEPRQDIIKGPTLGVVARVAVKDESPAAVGVGNPRFNDSQHDAVAHQPTGRHDLACRQPEFGAILDRLPENGSGRDVGQSQRFGEPHSLRALSGSRGAEKDDGVHVRSRNRHI